jgi:predicted DNA-binding protein (MmcQ/YjbR family)
MDIDDIREHCLSFPHTTENVQWGADLVFKVDGKMFAVAPLEVATVQLSFKCTPEDFAELCERPGIVPAPYMARAQWVALESLSAVPDDELRHLLAQSYALVWERFPQKRRQELSTRVISESKRKPIMDGSKRSAKKSTRKTKRAASGRRR